MSFRIQSLIHPKDTTNPKKTINQIDIDLIDAKYQKSKGKKQEQPVDPRLAEYKKNLVKNDTPYKRQRIIYDQTNRKWTIITE
jgi:hypothetical protein